MSIEMTSNKPYLVRAFYDWISDNELTPYILVDVTVPGVLVPMAFVQNNEIVLNISGGAVGSIALGDELIELSARFGGKLEHLTVPYAAIAAIYAKENGAGTALPVEHPEPEEESFSLSTVDSDTEIETTEEPEVKKPTKGKPTLKVIK